MKIVIWEDDDGYKRRYLLREIDPDHLAPSIGIPEDPPDLDRLDWDALKKDLHNLLVDRGLIEWDDVLAAQNGVTTSLVSVFKRPLIGLYRQRAITEEQNGN